MPLVADILIWVAIALASLIAAAVVAPLAFARVPGWRSASGAHARPMLVEPADRRKAWHLFRVFLLVPSTLVALLVVESKDHTARWLVGIAIVLIVIWELGSCFGLSEPGARKKAWHELR